MCHVADDEIKHIEYAPKTRKGNLLRQIMERNKQRLMDGQIDAGKSDPYMPLCFAEKKEEI